MGLGEGKVPALHACLDERLLRLLVVLAADVDAGGVVPEAVVVLDLEASLVGQNFKHRTSIGGKDSRQTHTHTHNRFCKHGSSLTANTPGRNTEPRIVQRGGGKRTVAGSRGLVCGGGGRGPVKIGAIHFASKTPILTEGVSVKFDRHMGGGNYLRGKNPHADVVAFRDEAGTEEKCVQRSQARCPRL